MLKDISDDAVQVGEGEIITFEDNDDKETHIDLVF